MRKIVLFFALLLTQSLVAQNFRVSIATYVSKFTPTAIKEAGIAGVFSKIDQNKLYHYYIGDYNSEEEADEARLMLLQKGFVDARVIDLEEQKLWCGSPCPYFVNDFVYNHIGSDGLMVGSIFYLNGGSQITDSGKKTVREFAKILKKNPDFKIYLGGHTDSSGCAAANIYYAKQRLDRVKKQLLRYGIREKNIGGTVFGESMPLGGEKKYDRRVVLVIIDSTGQVVSRNRATVRIQSAPLARKK